MKAYIKEFLLRGLSVAAGGPVVLAIINGILGAAGVITALTPAEVCWGILSLTLLAFLCGGITVIYKVEQLPAVMAALIHGGVLYLGYLPVYLFNDWLKPQLAQVGIFTAIFVAGYALTWLVIYLCIRSSTRKLNRKLSGK